MLVNNRDCEMYKHNHRGENRSLLKHNDSLFAINLLVDVIISPSIEHLEDVQMKLGDEIHSLSDTSR